MPYYIQIDTPPGILFCEKPLGAEGLVRGGAIRPAVRRNHIDWRGPAFRDLARNTNIVQDVSASCHQREVVLLPTMRAQRWMSTGIGEAVTIFRVARPSPNMALNAFSP